MLLRARHWQLWEFFHKGIGYGAVLAATATIFTGLRLITPAAPTIAVAIYVLSAVALFIAFLVLECVRQVRSPVGPR